MIANPIELQQLIQKLREERPKLDEVIASLERLEQTKTAAKPFLKTRRGRKFMDAAGRQEVSERMKKYWAGRRAAKVSK